MILMAVVSLGLMVGMPKLMDSSMFYLRSHSHRQIILIRARSGSRDARRVRGAAKEQRSEQCHERPGLS